VGNWNDFWFEPIGEIKGIDAGEHQHDNEKNPIFCGHKN
jgi:hypothetical protein